MDYDAEGFRPVTLDNSWVVEYLTSEGGLLRVEPAAIEASYRFRVELIGGDTSTTRIICQVRLADNQGRMWECESAFTAYVFLLHLLDASRKEPPRLAEHLPDEWREALEGPALAENTYEGYDHRTHRYFYLDGRAWYVRFKYQGAYHDVYPLAGTRILVRTRALWGEAWNPLPLEDESGQPLPAGPPYLIPDYDEDEEAYAAWEESEEAGGEDTIPDLFHEMDLRPLLFRSRLSLQGESWFDDCLPSPLIFKRVAGAGPPQPAVSVRQAAPVSPPRAAQEVVFTTWTFDSRQELDLRTNAGGFLHLVAEGLLNASVSFEVAPGSEREAQDVILGRVRLADEEGGLWESVARFTPEAFVEGLTALLPGDGPVFLEGERKNESPPLPGGIRGVLDDGGWRHFLVGEWAVSIRFANQKPRFDLFGGSYRLGVQVRGLVGYRRPIELENHQGLITWKPDQQAELVEEELPPIAFQMDYEELLFRNTTFAVDDGFWHGNDLPIPIVFERLLGSGEPQEGVVFRPTAVRE
jgi:hypothetical protein